MVKVVEYTLEDEVPPALKARRYFSRIVLRVQTKAAEEGKRYEIRKVQVGDFVLLRTRTYQAGADDEDKADNQVARVVSIFKVMKDTNKHKEGEQLMVVRWLWRRGRAVRAPRALQEATRVYDNLMSALPKGCQELYYASKCDEANSPAESVVAVELILRKVEVCCLAVHKRNFQVSINDLTNVEFFYRLALRCNNPAVFHPLDDIYVDETCPLAVKVVKNVDHYAVKKGFNPHYLPPSVFNSVIERTHKEGSSDKLMTACKDAQNSRMDPAAAAARRDMEGTAGAEGLSLAKSADNGGGSSAPPQKRARVSGAHEESAIFKKVTAASVADAARQQNHAQARRPSLQAAQSQKKAARQASRAKDNAADQQLASGAQGHVRLVGVPVALEAAVVMQALRAHLVRHGSSALAEALLKVSLEELWRTSTLGSATGGGVDEPWVRDIATMRAEALCSPGRRNLIAHFRTAADAAEAIALLWEHMLLLTPPVKGGAEGSHAPSPLVATKPAPPPRPPIGESPDVNPGWIVNHDGMQGIVAGHFAQRNTLEFRQALEWRALSVQAEGEVQALRERQQKELRGLMEQRPA